jgi:hypothetical protein
MGSKIAVKDYGEKALPRIGILLSTDITSGWGSNKGFRHLYARPVEIAADGAPRNLGDRQPLCDVQMRGQMDDQTPRFYGLDVEVHADTYPYINLQRAKVIASTLATIAKRMDSLVTKYGYSDDAATRILRFADVVGADAFIVKVGEDRGTTYSDNSWREMDAATAQNWINSREREAIEAFAS